MSRNYYFHSLFSSPGVDSLIFRILGLLSHRYMFTDVIIHSIARRHDKKKAANHQEDHFVLDINETLGRKVKIDSCTYNNVNGYKRIHANEFVELIKLRGSRFNIYIDLLNKNDGEFVSNIDIIVNDYRLVESIFNIEDHSPEITILGPNSSSCNMLDFVNMIEGVIYSDIFRAAFISYEYATSDDFRAVLFDNDIYSYDGDFNNSTIRLERSVGTKNISVIMERVEFERKSSFKFG